jgi:hypothetical protein
MLVMLLINDTLQGRTALSQALENNRVDVSTILQQHGGQV